MRPGGIIACALALLAACSHAGVTAPSAVPLKTQAILPSKAAALAPRLFPPTHGPSAVAAGFEHDGSKRLLAYGLRVVEHPDGSLEVGDELLPAARSARFLELPERLGGGFLFWIVSSSVTLLYRASSWTAPLSPVAQLDFEVERLVPGFDRLLVLPRRDADFRALDLDTGKAVPPLGLPVAPTYGSMAFVDGWFGAVQVPLRGLLLSFDAGGSWHPLSLPVTSFEPSDDSLALATSDGDYLLSARGELSRVSDADTSTAATREAAEAAHEAAPTGRLGSSESLLQVAVLTGVPDGKGGAFVANTGNLLRVALDTGRVLEKRERAFSGAGECWGVKLGAGAGFVCGEGRELTRIYRLTEPFGLELLLELPGARAVSDSESGALVVHGGCKRAGGRQDYCIVPARGAPFEIVTATERDRVVALGDGRAVAVTPPAPHAPGSLSIFGGGVVKSVPLAATRPEPRHKQLIEQGIWLDGMVETKPGVLAGWVVGAGPFSGVELTLDGKLTTRRIQDNAGRTLFAGARALVLGENGLASESVDGGQEWQPVELPPEIDLKAAQTTLRQGCSSLGCGFAGFTRVGWFDGHAPRSLAAPASPPHVGFSGPGGSRWLLHCAPTGQATAPALPVRTPSSPTRRLRRFSAPAPTDELELPPLSPLLERPAPQLPEGFEGVDAGTEPYGIQTRVYAFGPHGGDWSKAGGLSIAFADPFAVKGGVHATSSGRCPWPDASTAADALGAEPSTSSAGLAAVLDPQGNMGALLLSSRGTLDLLVFEADRAPLHIPNVGRLGMAMRASGVVKTKSGVFIGSYDENSRSFRVYRVVGQDLDVVLEVPDIPSPRTGASAELVRSAAGDALAIWVQATGWYVHPLDLESATVEAPFVVTPAQLSSLPPRCSPQSEGFLLNARITPDAYADAPAGVSMRGFYGRFRVSSLGVCIDALAAQGDGGDNGAHAAALPQRAAGRPTVTTALSERKPLGRRVELSCGE